MRHGYVGRKLNRTWAHRESMFKTMVTQLIKHDAINTTLPKAKELRKLADHMTTLAKKGTLHARRQARSIVREEAVVQKLFTEHPLRFEGREGGYTRVERLLNNRYGDNAPMARISYLEEARLLEPEEYLAKLAATDTVVEAAEVEAAAVEATAGAASSAARKE